MSDKLAVAFIWHMHQPYYKDNVSGQYLMPWVRLHGIKDYLDMLVLLKDYPHIKQTFNLVPSLIDQIQEYVNGTAIDEYMRISLLPSEQLTDHDKRFILRRFFDCNHHTKVVPNPHYKSLLEKRNINADIENFSLQEYEDIIVWFNLAWFDPIWFKHKHNLFDLYNKKKNYTYEDRRTLIEIQIKILRDIIPTYKKFQENNQIEISTSPYYHPILPLLINTQEASIARPDLALPRPVFQYPEDAEAQVIKSIQQYINLFGTAPKGIWPSEQSVSPDVIDLFIKNNFQWTLSDEGVLAKSLNEPIRRDINNNVINHDILYRPYKAVSKKKDGHIHMVFRDIHLSDLLGFSYFHYEPSQAANDLYNKLKYIQKKTFGKMEATPLVTIALDGENCWENYTDDGLPFLKALYRLFEEDQTLDLTTVSDYITQTQGAPQITKIHSGSWINQDYHIWIGAKEKNTAWSYLQKVREDFENTITTEKTPLETVNNAKEELYIAQGSDWFWWYGPPNYSDHDDLFDHQFRLHLANVYKILGKPVPTFLETPIYEHRLNHRPLGKISPAITGSADTLADWENAGYELIPQTSMHDSNKVISAIYYGNDAQNVYFRLHINTNLDITYSEKIYIYTYLPCITRFNSPIRLRSVKGKIMPCENFLYAHELAIVPYGNHYILQISEACENFRWVVRPSTNYQLAIGNVIELSVPFEELSLDKTHTLAFVVYRSMMGTIQESYPISHAIIMDKA